MTPRRTAAASTCCVNFERLAVRTDAHAPTLFGLFSATKSRSRRVRSSQPSHHAGHQRCQHAGCKAASQDGAAAQRRVAAKRYTGPSATPGRRRTCSAQTCGSTWAGARPVAAGGRSSSRWPGTSTSAYVATVRCVPARANRPSLPPRAHADAAGVHDRDQDLRRRANRGSDKLLAFLPVVCCTSLYASSLSLPLISSTSQIFNTVMKQEDAGGAAAPPFRPLERRRATRMCTF